MENPEANLFIPDQIEVGKIVPFITAGLFKQLPTFY
ncbi:MAG: hypothetical protein ACI9UV_001970 [Algoriphagus sp.]|jgi:hypothetical protein